MICRKRDTIASFVQRKDSQNYTAAWPRSYK